MISVQNDEELNIFKDHLQLLIVPQRLPNGKMSACQLKPVSIYFEDAGTEEGGNKGVRSLLSLWPKTQLMELVKQNAMLPGGMQGKLKTAAQSGTRLDDKDIKVHIAKLQERWICSTHTKSPEIPVYCYLASDNVCYPLTFSNLHIWALEMVSPFSLFALYIW